MTPPPLPPVWDLEMKEEKIVVPAVEDRSDARGRSQEAPTKWQPISTAPRDPGVVIWLGGPGFTCLARWDPEDGYEEPFWERWGGKTVGTGIARWKDEPTHWQPYEQPDPPLMVPLCVHDAPSAGSVA